jgi:hypothetical protein
MRKSSRLWSLAVIMALAIGGSAWAGSRWLGELNLNYLTLSPIEPEITAEEDDQSLAARSLATMQRIRLKAAIAEDLASGRLDLLQAACQFRELNTSDDEFMPMLRRSHPDMSDDEANCRNVIDFTRHSLARRSGAKSAVAQLEARFKELRGQPGGLHLPR